MPSDDTSTLHRTHCADRTRNDEDGGGFEWS
jgi:hypothetical protein